MESVPNSCPGTNTELAGKATPCQGCPNQAICSSASEGVKKQDADIPLIQEAMDGIKNILVVMSGKGGVGKSTFACQLAYALARDENVQVGILDIDICGPSVPVMMNCSNETVHASRAGLSPVYVQDNLAVMSIGFLLQSEQDAVIWRGPKKNGLIRQFLRDVDWGSLDYLIIDTPPGTSDEHLTIVQLLLKLSNIPCLGSILVTTPQEVALQDVRKEIDFCKKVHMPILGVVENMSGFYCKSCLRTSDIFPKVSGGAKSLCTEYHIPLLGSIPISSAIARECDQGKSVFDSDDKVFLDSFHDILKNLQLYIK
jgi:Mrp family chromosome partitioning ATPase